LRQGEQVDSFENEEHIQWFTLAAVFAFVYMFVGRFKGLDLLPECFHVLCHRAPAVLCRNDE
jgi:hypothetical protein